MTPSVDDLGRYLAGFGSFKDTGGFVVSFKANAEIRTPDLKSRLDALHTVMQRSTRKTLTADDVLFEYWSLTLNRMRGDHSDNFFKELKKRGFSAMIDDNDVGIFGEKPMILFDSEKVSKKTSAPLHDGLIASLLSSITEIPNRR